MKNLQEFIQHANYINNKYTTTHANYAMIMVTDTKGVIITLEIFQIKNANIFITGQTSLGHSQFSVRIIQPTLISSTEVEYVKIMFKNKFPKFAEFTPISYTRPLQEILAQTFLSCHIKCNENITVFTNSLRTKYLYLAENPYSLYQIIMGKKINNAVEDYNLDVIHSTLNVFKSYVKMNSGNKLK